MAEKTLDELVYYFDSYENATNDSRSDAEKSRDYYDGNQWTSAEQSIIRSRGQEPIVLNRIAPKIDYLLGYEQQGRSSPKAYPRGPSDEEAANAATDALRYVADTANWAVTRSLIWAEILIEGTGMAEVGVEPKGPDLEIYVRHIPWDRQFYDPRSRYLDGRDAKFLGSVLWMDLEDAQQAFPHAADVLDDAVANFSGETISGGETTDDRPQSGVWIDSQERRPRVKIVQIAYREGPDYDPDWWVATYCRSDFIYEPIKSPYVDEYNNTVCPFIMQSAKIDRDNNRYGIVKALWDPQYEINHRRSKALHLLNMRQTIRDEGSVEDPRRMKMELSKPDGDIMIRPGSFFQINPTGDMAQGHFQLLAEAKAEIDAIGANASLTGRDPRTQSGRALQARQQGGVVELEPIYGGLKMMQKTIFEHVWLCIRQFWRGEKWIRVTEDPGNIRFVRLNEPQTMYELMIESGQELPPIETLPPEIQQELSQVVGLKNDVGQMEVDVIVDDSPNVVDLQSEQFELLVQLAQSGAVQFSPETLIRASGLRDKDRILKEMRSGGATDEEQQAQQAQQQQQQQIQQQAVQLQLQQAQADVEKTRTEAAKNMATAEKTQSETHKNRATADKTKVDTAHSMAALMVNPSLPPA